MKIFKHGLDTDSSLVIILLRLQNKEMKRLLPSLFLVAFGFLLGQLVIGWHAQSHPVASSRDLSSTALSAQLPQLIEKHCLQCHLSFSNPEVLKQNLGQISKRLDWSRPNSMPLQDSPQRQYLSEHREELESLRRLVQGELAQVKGQGEERAALPLEKIKLPQGFHISLFAEVPGARSMALSKNGTLYVGTGGLGGEFNRVYALRDNLKQGQADEVRILLEGLNTPNGVAIWENDLYVAEISRVLKFPNIENNLAHPPEPSVFNDTFPQDRMHGWKYIKFAKDGSLIVPVGAPCNLCLNEKTHALIFRLSPDGKKKEIIAEGVRNTVGFDFHPQTGELFFTNNGRDSLGEDLPPETFNRIPANSIRPPHFGYPFCHAGRISDPEFGDRKPCSQFLKPALELPAHVAPLGVHFYTGKQFPKEYLNQAFIAEHGSWNRTIPQGYRVSLAWSEDRGRSFKYKIFAEGWLNPDGTRWGRPVDVLQWTDGSLLVSDDYAGVIYRITYQDHP